VGPPCATTTRVAEMDDIAYKVLLREEFLALQHGSFAGAAIDLKDGYIHLSTAAQLDETIDKHFAGIADLVIAAVDLRPLREKIRWEVSRNGALFAHLYGHLECSSIVATCRADRGADGRIKLPAEPFVKDALS
jgi:uncharacterized protein (DUF952 family)